MVKMMRLLLFLPLAVLVFSFLNLSKGPPAKHQITKAIVFLNDSQANWQWDDDKKNTTGLPLLLLLAIALTRAPSPSTYFSKDIPRNRRFLTPIFHQSNYVILPPALQTQK
jgi:hypothetical protein